MNPLLKKMNFKGHGPILVVNPPEEFKPHIAEFQKETGVHCKPSLQRYPFALVFVLSEEQILENAAKLTHCLRKTAAIGVHIRRNHRRNTKLTSHGMRVGNL